MNARPAAWRDASDPHEARWQGTGVLDELRNGACAELRPGLDQLEAVLLECHATGVHRLHIEFEGTTARVRLRQPAELETRRLSQGKALRGALEQVHHSFCAEQDRCRCLVLADGVRLDLSLTCVSAGHVDSWYLMLRSASRLPVLLDQHISEKPTRERVFAALNRPRGLIAIVGEEVEPLHSLATAIALACVSPDKKVLRIERDTMPRLAGVVQVALSQIEPARQAATCRALLMHDADVIVADAGLPAGTGQLLDALSTHRLVVRVVQTTSHCDVLPILRADGAGGAWLAEHLALAIRVDLMRRLCPGCSRSIEPPAQESLSLSDSPARQLLAMSLGRFATADGCASCFHSGIGDIEHRVDAMQVTAVVQEMLRDDLFADAQSVLDARRTTPAYAFALARSGQLSPREAARLGAV